MHELYNQKTDTILTKNEKIREKRQGKSPTKISKNQDRGTNQRAAHRPKQTLKKRKQVNPNYFTKTS